MKYCMMAALRNCQSLMSLLLQEPLSSRAYEDLEQRAQIRGTSSPETPGTSSDRDTARPPKKKQRKGDQDEISNLITTTVTTLKDINTTEHEEKGKHMLFGQ